MNRLFKFILIMLFYWLNTYGVLANVSVWVHPTIVAPDETLTLTISVEGSAANKPDFSVLEKDFQLLAYKNNSSVDMTRGSTQIKINWDVILLPRTKGKMLIPAIKVGNQYTSPLTIEVRNKPTVVHSSKEDIFIELEAIPSQAYVHSQVLLKQRLYYAVTLDKAELSIPIVRGNAAEIIALTTRPTYQRKLNGKEYSVIERSYAVFPKKSGEITIEPAEFKGLVADGNTVKTFDAFNLYTRKQRAKRIVSKPLTILIKARAVDFSAKDWLPANNISVYGKWSIAAGSKVPIGEPISLDMGIISSGLRSASIPDLEFDLPKGIKMYAEKPRFDFSVAHSGLSGIRKQKITFIATRVTTQSGIVKIPTLRLAWWNTVTDQQEEAVLAGISFKVLAAADTHIPVEVDKIEVDTLPSTEKNQVRGLVFFTAYSWWWQVLGGALLMVLFSIFYYYYRSRLKRPKRGSAELFSQLLATASAKAKNNTKNELNHDVILKKLQCACEDAKPIAAQHALQHWSEQIADIKPATLSVIAAINVDFEREVAYLSQALYAKEAVQWQGQGLWQVVKHYQGTSTDSDSVENKRGLQHLYPKI